MAVETVQGGHHVAVEEQRHGHALHVNGNQVKASALLGISRTTLRSKLRALHLGIEETITPA